ncbi:hypothetical protein SUGI_0323830 [Cryptomeria japonica]|nr:hypothetical protein SUGI_0323830 [Cryptomeria japonica]
MGGHGGLNILPQKRWNVYNFDNRERVRKDEEAAAREEELKREQSARRDAEFRLEKLRQANQAKRGFQTPQSLPSVSSPQTLAQDSTQEELPDSDSKHINLFQGWNGFQMEGEKSDDRKEKKKDDSRPPKKQKKMKEGGESVRTILPEDEKYRLGYGVAGKDAKTPWYLSKSSVAQQEENEEDERRSNSKEFSQRNGEMRGKKRSLQELREERLRREQQERERAQKLLFPSTSDSRIKRDSNGQNRAVSQI